MKQSSPIDIVEAAYHVGQASDPWLRGVLDATAPLMEPCIGVAAYFLDSASPTVDGVITAGAPWYRSEEVAGILMTMPRAPSRRFHFGVARMATTMSEVMGHGEVLRHDYDDLFRRIEAMRQAVPRPGHAAPIREFLGLLAMDAEGRGVVISGAYGRPFALDRASRRRWTLVAVHIATAARLRRALEASQGALAPTEAVLSSNGRVEHAEGDAKPRAALESIRARAVAIDRARSRKGRSDPDAALEAWRGLVSGRWSLVDRFESDGRRYVVAHRNEPRTARVLALTPRERQVVSHLLLGHTSKVTAYTLGISPSAVSAALKSAMQKLRARSSAQLLHRLSGITGGR
ncbi:MAG: LuxR C-terminal-related transcriptional regulator [Polyangiaceae bacterium]|jgi:DNA-binding CsgD family transcriptional regulator